MKRITKIIFIMTFLIFSIIINGSAIKNYDVVMNINKDSTLTVTETIEYKFDSSDRGEIFWDVFLREKNMKNLKKSLIKINSIMRNKKNEKYEYETFDKKLRLKIGSEDRKITQLTNIYEIKYTMYSDISKYNDIQQIYFNIIGQFWNVPIEKANITIRFGDGQPITSEEISKFEIYTGKTGAVGTNYKILQENKEIKFTTQKPLAPKEGITFLLNLKTDKISPNFSDKLKIFFTTSKYLIFNLILFLISITFMIITKLIILKQPPKEKIILRSEVPNDMSAMFVSYFKDKHYQNRLLNAGILSLITNGSITKDGKKMQEQIGELNNSKLYPEEINLFDSLNKISSNKKTKKFVISSKSLNLIIKDFSQKYNSLCEDKDFYYLFPLFISITICMMNTFDGNVINLFSVLRDLLTSMILATIIEFFVYLYHKSKRFFRKKFFKNMLTIVKWLLIISIMLTYFNRNILSSIALILLLIVNGIYYRNLKIYSEEGLRKKEYIEGLKKYIKTATKDQIKKFDDSEKLVNYFKEVLPYAIALNLKHNFIKLFEETIKINSDLPGISNVSKTINDLFIYSKQLNRSIRIISYKTRTHSLSSSSSDTFSSLESDYDSDDK